ncbi:MAG: hypothetical protein CV045_09310 [Cyanobacteria bacterium M5B4]|nr:MAG: hypothetical protein CV045_09310 [Cyanobacteria bacterium M5B4]
MLTTILLLSTGMVTIAQAKPNCKDIASLNQRDLNFCAAADAKLADAKLNQVYRQLRAKHKENPSEENALISAQLAWIKFRDQNCKFAEVRFEQGSIAPLIFHKCIERVTNQRVEELERYLKGLASRDGL